MTVHVLTRNWLFDDWDTHPMRIMYFSLATVLKNQSVRLMASSQKSGLSCPAQFSRTIQVMSSWVYCSTAKVGGKKKPDVRTTLRLAKKEWYRLPNTYFCYVYILLMVRPPLWYKGHLRLKPNLLVAEEYEEEKPDTVKLRLYMNTYTYLFRDANTIILTISCEYSIRRHTDLNPKFLWSSRWCSYVSQLPSRSPTLRPERCNSSCSHLYARDLVDLMSKAASASDFFNLPFRQFYF